MLEQHIDSGAGATVAAIRAPISQAHEFGVIETAGANVQIAAFREKPVDARPLPDSPHQVFASMGNYIFTTQALLEAVSTDAADKSSKHDMGGNIIPMMVEKQEGAVYDFTSNDVPGSTDRDRNYWRDVGTLDAYYDAHMDLISLDPEFNLYNYEWPILTWQEPFAPAKFVHDSEGRVGHALNSMVCAGAIVSGGEVRRSVISPGVRVNSYAQVEGSVLMHGVRVGRHAIVRNAIVDKDVHIPEGARVGVDLELDRQRFRVSEGGIVAIGKGEKVQ